MGTQPQPRKTLFGPFEYDDASGDLRKLGSRIRLQGKALQILEALLEHPGQVVSREHLQQELWQGTTFVDFEQGLNAAVNKLRRALGDSADQPRYIETVPGRGYRFIAPLRLAPLQSGLSRPVLEIAPSPAPPSPAKSWLPWTAAAAVVLLAVSVYWFSLRPKQPPELPKASRFTVTPPAGYILEATNRSVLALSPDGGRLAYTAMAPDGGSRVFLRDFDSLESRPLPGSVGAYSVFWPPDGKSVFLAARGKIHRTTLTGDAYVSLGNAPSFLFSGAWLSPERLLLGGSQASHLMPLAGGPLQQLDRVFLWPQLLPDGEHILSIKWDTQAHVHRARVSSLNQPDRIWDLVDVDSRVQYTASAVSPSEGYLLYVRAGNLVALPFDARGFRVTGEAMPVASKLYSFFPNGAADFSASNQGTIAYLTYAARSQLAWVDRQGKRLSSIGPPNVNVKYGRLSPDGRKLAAAIYDLERGAQNLWIFDTKTNTGRQLTLDPGLRDAPVWSPDSRTLAFLHGCCTARPPQIHFRGLTEHDLETEWPIADFQLPTDWSPDGRFVAFVNTGFPQLETERQGDIWLMDRAHGDKLIPLVNSPFHEANAAFSPDGKWLAFTSSESGQTELYVQEFRGGDTPQMIGERHPVSRAGALAVRWRRDGKELFYLGFDGRVYAVPVRLLPAPEFGSAAPLFRISAEAFAAIHSLDGFDVSADGQRFVIPVVSASEGPSLVVIQNWESALR